MIRELIDRVAAVNNSTESHETDSREIEVGERPKGRGKVKEKMKTTQPRRDGGYFYALATGTNPGKAFAFKHAKRRDRIALAGRNVSDDRGRNSRTILVSGEGVKYSAEA